jgi:hypothetical protein
MPHRVPRYGKPKGKEALCFGSGGYGRNTLPYLPCAGKDLVPSRSQPGRDMHRTHSGIELGFMPCGRYATAEGGPISPPVTGPSRPTSPTVAPPAPLPVGGAAVCLPKHKEQS